jgi:hypothetical protein
VCEGLPTAMQADSVVCRLLWAHGYHFDGEPPANVRWPYLAFPTVMPRCGGVEENKRTNN